jgi:DNA-binding GntR family transcriptional regulator
VVLSVADRRAGDLPALVADHEHLIAIIGSGDAPAAIAALEDHLARGAAAGALAAARNEVHSPAAAPD